jgi:hypothetical protein
MKIEEDQLLTRDEFRNGVFERDGHKCVVCGKPAVDAHHILERRLWKDGGYYLANGSSVCEEHHLAAESTELSCDKLRELCGIKKILLPEHLYSDQEYDKWGNPVLPNGQRLKGELFHDESVQKVIRPALHLFTSRVKYPRTYHFPWSPGGTDDDRKMQSLAGFEGEEVVVTAKMDGEQTSMYVDGFHARSIDTPAHPSRDWVWAVWRQLGHDIPEGWRFCWENLYARHAIHYKNLEAYLQLISIWNEKNICLSWSETVEWAQLLGVKQVPVLYEGLWDEAKVKACLRETYNGDPCEGYVVRVIRRFSYKEFKDVVGKYVRKNHVQTHGHWMREAVVKNELRKEGS